MTKRASEGAFGLALRNVDLDTEVYKPGDNDMNMKPCDFFVWIRELVTPFEPDLSGVRATSAWFEVKDVPSADRFSFREVRASQWGAIRRAKRLGIPYWIAVYWRRHRMWTISDAVKLLDWREGEGATADGKPASWISKVYLASRFGIDSEPANLVSTLKGVLLGEV